MTQSRQALGIMQPYFLPYIGYFQLISAVDSFVVYDNIKYTKKGWISRNRFLLNNNEALFSLELKNESNSLYIKDRYLSDSFSRIKLFNKFKEAYRRAPNYEPALSLLNDVIFFKDNNLFEYIFNSIKQMCLYLEISTPLTISSTISADHSLKGAERVIAICKEKDAHQYINPIGGLELYSKDNFAASNIQLNFLRSKAFNYKQFEMEFVPWLSIVDVIMFNPVDVIKEYLREGFHLE